MCCLTVKIKHSNIEKAGRDKERKKERKHPEGWDIFGNQLLQKETTTIHRITPKVTVKLPL